MSKEYPASQAECSEGLGLYRETSDIPPVWAAKQRQEFPSHGRLSRLFSGSLHDGEEICLHRDAPSRPPLQYSVKDIDSSIAIFSDLNRFQKPISLTIIPQPASLLKKSIHLSYPVEVNGEVKSVPIHKIPHMQFATAGTRSHAIYAFFPAMYSPDPKASVYLSDKAYQAFYEDIIHPGLLQLPLRARSGHLGNGWAETSQHLPATFEAALAISRAAAERSGNEGGTRGRPINITFTPSSDPQVWDEMFLRLRDPTAQEPGEYDRRSFCNLFFLYDSKGTKLETQRQRALGPCIQDFRAEQAAYFPENAAVSSDDRQYIDIAATVYALNDGHYPLGSTLLAKRCCVYNTVRTILEGEDEPTEGIGLRDTGPAAARPPQPPRTVVTEYPINLLRDTVTLTAEPTATHPHAADGLVYIQTYSPVKELFDARGIFPFSHPGILNLGYSNVDCSTIHSLQRTASDRAKAKASDCRSRKRVRIATDSDGGGSGWFGWRTELRVSLALANIIQEEDSSWDDFLAELYRGTQRRATSRAVTLVPVALTPVPVNDITIASRAFYVHRTENYRHFLRGNIHKHLIAIDTIRALYSGSQVAPMAGAALHAVLVLSLRHFISHLPYKEAWILNNDIRVPDSLTRQPGLGLAATRRKSGFAFFNPDIIDWRDLKLAGGYEDRITVPGFQRVVRFRTVLAYQDVRSFIDQLLEAVNSNTSEAACEFIMEKCVHLILQDFRDISLRKLLGEDGARRVCDYPQASGQHFSFEGLGHLAGKVDRNVSRVTGNKSFFKRAGLFFTWLWTDDPISYKRNNIQNLSFRTLAKVAYETLGQAGSRYATPTRFQRILGYRFFEQHNAVPYPDSNGSLVQVSRSKTRVLLCFRPLDAVELVPRHISLSELLGRVEIIGTGWEKVCPPAPVPGCLDKICTVQEALAWMRDRRNLVCYM